MQNDNWKRRKVAIQENPDSPWVSTVREAIKLISGKRPKIRGRQCRPYLVVRDRFVPPDSSLVADARRWLDRSN